MRIKQNAADEAKDNVNEPSATEKQEEELITVLKALLLESSDKVATLTEDNVLSSSNEECKGNQSSKLESSTERRTRKQLKRAKEKKSLHNSLSRSKPKKIASSIKSKTEFLRKLHL